MNFLGPKCIEIFFDLFLRENSNIDVFCYFWHTNLNGSFWSRKSENWILRVKLEMKLPFVRFSWLYFCYIQLLGEHESSSSPKWTHLNALHSGHGGGNASGGNGGSGNGINNNSNVHSSFKTLNTDHPAPVGTYASHLPPHHPSTISSQFSALLGASSAGYLLSSSEASKTTMPIFWLLRTQFYRDKKTNLILTPNSIKYCV